jgi:predicted nucleic acid-binding OB-fold protein
MYCIGVPSCNGYAPQRKLKFDDEEHLRAILRSSEKGFIKYFDKIDSISKHIFIDNPFNIMLEEADNKTIYYQMLALRNYIAHESPESRKKYITTCLNNREFIEPSDYLMEIRRRTSKSNYTTFMNKIDEISTLILESPLL